MLGRLIKNEFKATARNFVPVYLVMLVVTLLLKLFLEITDFLSIPEGPIVAAINIFLMIAFVLAIIAVIFGTIVFIIKRYYDNMLKDEGYLSFTLPVTTGQHIVSKALTSYVWIIASMAVIALSVVMLMLGEPSFFKAISEGIDTGIKFLSDNGYWGYAIAVFAAIIIGIYVMIIEAYTCMSVGQLMNKHRVAGAVITYMVIYSIKQVFSMTFLTIRFMGSVNSGTAEMEMTSSQGASISTSVLIYELVLLVVEAIVFTFITHMMMKRKLNLE